MTSRLLLLPLLVWLSGCSGNQSALQPEGHSAVLLRDLILVFAGICCAVWLAVMAVMLWAIMRRRRVEGPGGDRTDQRMTVVVSIVFTLTVAIISGLTILSFYTTRGLAVAQGDIVTIRVRSQQWWWQFIYTDANPGLFQTANELHIPVGRDVRLQLESPDVIHSFWVPALAGKQDLVPGRVNTLTFRADRAGVYRGQCAEFCGMQHSHMAFFVVAEDEAGYRRWAEAQSQPAVEPDDGEAAMGRAVFMKRQCSACHTIRGTEAGGATGPDLTHVGSRGTIGAGLLETTRGSLAAWIADPQTLKPGNNMPLVPLTSDELRQVAAYMESLR